MRLNKPLPYVALLMYAFNRNSVKCAFTFECVFLQIIKISVKFLSFLKHTFDAKYFIEWMILWVLWIFEADALGNFEGLIAVFETGTGEVFRAHLNIVKKIIEAKQFQKLFSAERAQSYSLSNRIFWEKHNDFNEDLTWFPSRW